VFDYQYYLYETRFPDLVNIYHRDRVFIAVSDSTSKISTCFIIPKRQCFGVKKWKNYSYKVVDDRLYFVYNQLSYDIQHSDNISGWIHIVEFSPGEAPKVKSVSTEEFQFPLRPENMWLPDGRVILEMQDPSNTRGVFTAYDVAPE
jgi:hypothetical protein